MGDSPNSYKDIHLTSHTSQHSQVNSEQLSPHEDCNNSEHLENEDISIPESISENIPSRLDSVTESNDLYNISKTKVDQHFINKKEKVGNDSNFNVSQQQLSSSDKHHSLCELSTSLPLDIIPNVDNISKESPVNLVQSSDLSIENVGEKSSKVSQLQDDSDVLKNESDNSKIQCKAESSSSNSLEFNKAESRNINDEKDKSENTTSSDELIKLDIRGQCTVELSADQLFFLPSQHTSIGNMKHENVSLFSNLFDPISVNKSGFKIEELELDFDQEQRVEEINLSESNEDNADNKAYFEECLALKDNPLNTDSDNIEQNDLLIEEMTIEQDIKEKKAPSTPLQQKSVAQDDLSFSTLNTDYKTICDEYNIKLSLLENAIKGRDELIGNLTLKLQRLEKQRNSTEIENNQLRNEVHNLQQVISEDPEYVTIKPQLSDRVKYQSMLKEDVSSIHSPPESSKSSIKSNDERDMDKEEMTVNYSKSDSKTDTSDSFLNDIEQKVTQALNELQESIDENVISLVKDKILQLFYDEVGKIRLDYDTDVKELEGMLEQDRQACAVEIRHLRNMLETVKTGNVEIDDLRKQLNLKHEKEMKNLRMYFEKVCNNMERSYSEKVLQEKIFASSALSLEEPDAAGDHVPRRARSADLPLAEIELSAKPSFKDYEKQIEEIKMLHLLEINELHARHKEQLASLEEQIVQLKAHIQTAENTEATVPMLQQDIDSELENKDMRIEEIRQEVIDQVQEQIQVLLSEPDAELSSWPLELVALRNRIQEEVARHLMHADQGVVDLPKWKQRRNFSFDQNRQLEVVTKERDALRGVAGGLRRAVSQLVAYCAAADDELNGTLLAALLLHRTSPEDSCAASPNITVELNSSQQSKRVHFAPEIQELVAKLGQLDDLDELDDLDAAGIDQGHLDLSTELRLELENSLSRLRQEAQELLELSCRPRNRQQESKMLEASQLQIEDLVDKISFRQDACSNCDTHKKMEEALSESASRESALRAQLDAALMRLARLSLAPDEDIVAEGYGTVNASPSRASIRARAAFGSAGAQPLSLDGCESPRASVQRLAAERDDLAQQLEAANRQLKSTRAFLSEQEGEREAERDEAAKRERELTDENAKLTARLQANARIVSEVEQLEAQTKEMNEMIHELERKKCAMDEELKASRDEISVLREVIANLESQLDQKSKHENEVLEQLGHMKRTIDERDSKVRALLGELESLRSEKMEQSELCPACAADEDKYSELMEKVQEQWSRLGRHMERAARRLECAHDTCSAPPSDRSEDVSLRDRAASPDDVDSALDALCESPCGAAEPANVRGAWARLARAHDALLKRLADLEMQRAQLKDVAQELRAERDVLQTRCGEAALRAAALGARLERQRHDAAAREHDAHAHLALQLHDATAEVERLKEELDMKEKQLNRLKQLQHEKDKLEEKHVTLYGNVCNPKDKVLILERELSAAQMMVAQLEGLVRTVEAEKDELQNTARCHQRALAEKEEQLQELLALKIHDDNPREDNSEIHDGAKTSARTLSDIVSISEFDEQDLQMRRAELKGQTLNVSEAPYQSDMPDKTPLNTTSPPKMQQPNMSSLNLDHVDHSDLPSISKRADSLPAHLTSTQNKDPLPHKRNPNETTLFGSIPKYDVAMYSTANKIQDNCSMYPNRNINDDKQLTVEPKRINFSQEPSGDNRERDEEFTSLGELGITIDLKQENFPDILTQMKHEIKKSRAELEKCRAELKHAEEQLCEFPALKEEVDNLKNLLESTVTTMKNDKVFYEKQLENFTDSKNMFEQRLKELTEEVTEKTNDLHILKEDILRRENMILELAKEKRNLTNKLAELHLKIEELQNKIITLENQEIDNHHLREQLNELNKMEQLVKEKNQQIDSLNQHLDRLDDLQRSLNEKTEELENLKEAFDEKSTEVFRLQNTIETLNRNMVTIHDENNKLNVSNSESKQKLAALEKQQENAYVQVQKSEIEITRLNTLNSELLLKLEELKLLTENLKDKEMEIEIYKEDMQYFHDEIASLREQLKLASRSPSPRSKNTEDNRNSARQTSNDKKQIIKIKKQISLLQHELDFNKKELNDKAFELARAKLDAAELKNSWSQAQQAAAERDSLRSELEQLRAERDALATALDDVNARLREEGNVEELEEKLRRETDRCRQLEAELVEARDLIDDGNFAARGSGARSPTRSLERALRRQLQHSHDLDDELMQQILSASSDEKVEVPRLVLNTSNRSTSSAESSSSERLCRLKSENEKLAMQVEHLHARIRDKDDLIAELSRVREQLVAEWQAARGRYEAERDTASRLQLLLDTHKETAESLQTQDTNMIQILKSRLESSMQSELQLQQAAQQGRERVHLLEQALAAATKHLDEEAHAKQLQIEIENGKRLQSELALARSRLEAERARHAEAAAAADRARQQLQKELDARAACCTQLREQMLELTRSKQECQSELARCRELAAARLADSRPRGRPSADAMELESQRSGLAIEVATLRKCLAEADSALGSPRLVCCDPDTSNVIGYLQGRCLQLESWRKALVWQKRYLLKELAGYRQLERRLDLDSGSSVIFKSRFKCVCLFVVASVRMRFLVKRRRAVRANAAKAFTTPSHTPNRSPAASSAGRTRRRDLYSTPSTPALREVISIGLRSMAAQRTPNTFSEPVTPTAQRRLEPLGRLQRDAT